MVDHGICCFAPSPAPYYGTKQYDSFVTSLNDKKASKKGWGLHQTNSFCSKSSVCVESIQYKIPLKKIAERSVKGEFSEKKA